LRSSTKKNYAHFALVLLSSTLLLGLVPRKLEPEIQSQILKKNWGLKSELSSEKIRSEKIRPDVYVTEAWKIAKGSKDVVVAVIDTGIDSKHPEISGKLWEKKNGNTTIYGWNFVSNAANPSDEHGHGTHVSGIISSISPKVSLMPIKYYSESNSGIVNLKNTIQAIHYAIDQGAKIINYSGGGPEFSEEEYLAIKRAESKGILIVAAAGNESQDTDKPEHAYYPAAYRVSNIISVAATDPNNELISSSNWGKKRVDLAAPGANIYSALPGGNYGYMTGTSQATAFVTGAAALLLSKNPNLTPSEIKEIITASVDTIPALSNRVASGGKLNIYKALRKLSGISLTPSAIAEQKSAPGELFRSLLPKIEPSVKRSSSSTTD
jgi:subtilisin family serine protease